MVGQLAGFVCSTRSLGIYAQLLYAAPSQSAIECIINVDFNRTSVRFSCDRFWIRVAWQVDSAADWLVVFDTEFTTNVGLKVRTTSQLPVSGKEEQKVKIQIQIKMSICFSLSFSSTCDKII
jgi:hypothetical protein